MLLALANEVFSSSGCGSTSDADGGPACEPSCPDALLDTPIDTHVEAAPEDAGACHAACAKQATFSGCPYPGCEAACEIVSTRCFQADHPAAHDALLACEAHAAFSCTPTDSGLLPRTRECNDAAAAVATECVVPEGGSDDGEAGACNTKPTKTDCDDCCASTFTDGFNTYNVALTSCACETPGPCATACADSLCADMTPDAGGSCASCIAKSLDPDGGCGSFVANACSADKNCTAYQDCLKTTCATVK